MKTDIMTKAIQKCQKSHILQVLLAKTLDTSNQREKEISSLRSHKKQGGK